MRTHNADEVPDTELLWSKGVARLCDIAGPKDYWRAETESVQSAAAITNSYSGAAGIVWIRLGTRSRDGETVDLDLFVDSVLPQIDRPFVLLTTDGDAAVPSQLRPETVTRLLGSPWLRAWYTQNCDVAGHDTIRPFPIGLSLHNRRPFGSPRRSAEELRSLAYAASPAAERPLVVYSDIGVSLASDDRRSAAQMLKNVPHVWSQRRRVSQSVTWQRYASARFVLSLKGNGIDAHRTWEALYLGAIVIALRSTLDPLYDGLPVVLLDRLDELTDPNNLLIWTKQQAPLADRKEVWKKLNAPLWVDRMRRHLP